MDSIHHVPAIDGRLVGMFGNIWVMSYMDMRAGEVIPMHDHPFDHVSLLATGQAEIHGTVYDGPQFFFVPAGVNHEIRVTQDGTSWICLHVCRDGDELPEEQIRYTTSLQRL
jgi:quercetin dioxygenase-like cupin family protein